MILCASHSNENEKNDQFILLYFYNLRSLILYKYCCITQDELLTDRLYMANPCFTSFQTRDQVELAER